MRANTSAEDHRARTFTESARRDQIARAAIETIAEVGYARASFARIAERAGLSSTGLISYHFAGKSELVEHALSQIYAEIRAFMGERMRGHATARDALRGYIEANIEFAGAHREQMAALLEIFMSGALSYDATTERAVRSPVEEILRRGQEAGEFRDFDVTVMATAIKRAVEGPVFLLTGDPDLDLVRYARELVTLFDLATRAEGR